MVAPELVNLLSRSGSRAEPGAVLQKGSPRRKGKFGAGIRQAGYTKGAALSRGALFFSQSGDFFPNRD
jgi:hypothetical protein